MYTDFQKHLQATLQEIKDAGLYKNERVIITPQSSGIKVEGGKDVINFCANNYLGLADNKELIQAAKDRMDARRVLRHGGYDPLRSLLRCQRWIV